MNIIFEFDIGETKSGVLSPNFTRSDFQRLAEQLFGSTTDIKFMIKGKQIKLNNDAEFNLSKASFKNDCVVKTAKIMISGYPPLHQLVNEISSEALSAFNSVQKTTNSLACPTCCETKQCIQFNCSQCNSLNTICAICAYKNFKTNEFAYKCLSCSKTVDYKRLFANSTSFNKKMDQLQDIYEMCLNIDCQVCRCGQLQVNATLYSKQYCSKCNRWYCFFCNKDWSDASMRNDQYSCHDNCKYENAITYEEVPINHGSKTRPTLPNRRTCPSCKKMGFYGGHCQYHTCLNCRHVFCFICLRPKPNCNFNSDKKCTLVSQSYNMFPKSTD